jgi:hypothetical protein
VVCPGFSPYSQDLLRQKLRLRDTLRVPPAKQRLGVVAVLHRGLFCKADFNEILKGLAS